MANYNIKKDAKVYLVHNSTRYQLEVTEEISFSQTFTDQTYSKRTLHNLNHFFDESNIKKANPANFEFTIPIIMENDLNIVHNLLLDYDTAGGHSLKDFDLYIETPHIVYKLDKCVITNGTYIIEKLETLTLGIQGQASKLTKEPSLPGTGQGLSIAARTNTLGFQQIKHLVATIGSTNMLDSLFRASVEVQNDIKWTPYETVDDALTVTTASTSMYPSNFTLEKRIVSGSFSRYTTPDNDSDVQTWDTDQAIVLQAGMTATTGFHFNLDKCTFTTRAMVDEVFSHTYDWKLNSNPTDLRDVSSGSYIKLNNI